MSVDPLKSLGYWSGKELAFEGAVPLTIAGYAFWKIKTLVSAPSFGKPLTSVELLVIVGAVVALVSWAISRQLFLFGKRKPSTIAATAVVLGVGSAFALASSAKSGFEATCVDQLKGVIVETVPFLGEQKGTVCQIEGLKDSPYVPGSLIRPSWNGQMDLVLLLFFLFTAITASVSFRDKRLLPTKLVLKLYKLLQFAPASGVNGILGEKPKDGAVQACTNATFWGEICGQMYSATKQFEPGEWCGRCNQTYVKAERELTFNVVSLFTDNIDLLNMLEKKDTLSWDVPGRIPPDGRQSGVERWVNIGKLTVPDVISVSQLLSIAHTMLSKWESDDERVNAAIDLAKKRASKLYGWIWFGRQNKRLTYARPTNKVLMAVGTTRLRDLITDSGDELYLQMDIGLLPIEMRSAFLKTFLDEARISRFQNTKFDMWVPVAPKLSVNLAGLWVPRVEGDALRKWLSTGRLQKEGKKGITVPRPYQVFETDEDEELPPLPVEPVLSPGTAQIEEIEEFEELEEESKEPDVTDFFDFVGETSDEEEKPVPIVEPEEVETVEEIKPQPTISAYLEPPQKIPTIKVKPGTLDIVRAPFNISQTEPVIEAVGIGDSIAEWDWLEPEQIQLLRQQCLVLVDMTQLRKR